MYKLTPPPRLLTLISFSIFTIYFFRQVSTIILLICSKISAPIVYQTESCLTGCSAVAATKC